MIIILAAFTFGWLVIVIKLFDLQIVNYETYQAKVLSNVQMTSTTKAYRGEIYDTDMNKLAANYTVYRIFISPHDITEDQEEAIAKGLSEILEVDYDKILTLTQKKYRWDETIIKKATEEQAEEVLAFKNEGGYTTQIYLEATQTRYYPYGSLASHVIGVVGTDGGLTGLEYYYDDYLTGESGKITISKDATGAQIYSEYENYVDASNGANIVTTINRQIQEALEEQLKAAYDDAQPTNRVTGIVMDCNTGAVLAMATYPNFDLNSPFTLDEASLTELEESGIDPSSEEYVQMQTELLYTLWSNKAVTEPYEPGSTFKIITASSGIEEGVITFDDELTCTGSYGGMGCHKKSGHGTVTFRVGLEQSCNPCLMQVGERLGITKFMKYFEAFGYKEKTGIDLPGEASSIYHSTASFVEGNLLAYSFGQSFKVTAIRHLTSICAVANGGELLQPYIVDRIIDDDGKILYQHERTVLRQVISEEVCEEVAEVLEEGTSGDGQAKNAKAAGYKISAKTGTSEKLDEYDEEGNATFVVGSTVAFAPSDDPQIAAIIIVDEPTCENKYGGVVAAPYISNLMEEILPVIGIDKVYSEEELKRQQFTMWGLTGWPVADAVKLVKGYGIDYEIVGDGTVVRYQVPAKGSVITKSEGKVYFYTGGKSPEYNIEIPNVVGKSVTIASKTLTKLGLNVVVNGAVNTSSSTEALIMKQSLEAGTYATKGMTITITAYYPDSTA